MIVNPVKKLAGFFLDFIYFNSIFHHMFRSRKQPESNYSAVFVNGTTLRVPLNADKPITELAWPEFYDVGINSYCAAACPFCYTDAKKSGINFSEIIEKIYRFFGQMTPNQRPFQVALGGSGESTAHPDFINVLRSFHELSIVPNYTTNAMHITPELIAATKEFCGGVAISLHPHLEKVWRKALVTFKEANIITNVHVIISDKASIDKFAQVYEEFKDTVEYFVLLPYMVTGRAPNVAIDYDYFEKALGTIKDHSKLAFGSNFYRFLKTSSNVKCSLYPPEIMSKYLIMDDRMSLYNNSFEMKPVGFTPGIGVELGKAADTEDLSVFQKTGS